MTQFMPDELPTPGHPHFGNCPRCGRTNGYLNIRSEHWFYCSAHRTKWCTSENQFSSWRDETPLDWERNRHRLSRFAVVEADFSSNDIDAQTIPLAEYERLVAAAEQGAQ